MKRDIKLFLDDMIDQIELIEDSTAGVKKSEFLKNKDLQDATVRRLEIIGEETKNIPPNKRASGQASQAGRYDLCPPSPA